MCSEWNKKQHVILWTSIKDEAGKNTMFMEKVLTAGPSAAAGPDQQNWTHLVQSYFLCDVYKNVWQKFQ